MSKVFEAKYYQGTLNDSVGGRTIALEGTPKIYKRNNCLALSNLGKLTYSTSILPSNAFTLVAFVRRNNMNQGGTNRSYIISSALGDNGSIMYDSGDGRFVLYLGTNNYQYLASTLQFGTNLVCVIVTIAGSGTNDIDTSKVYINNVELTGGVAVKTGSPKARDLWTFVGNSYGTNNIDIAYLAVHDTVISEKERNNYFKMFNNLKPITKPKRNFQLNKPTELKQNGLIAAYNMKPNGTKLIDISGNGRNGTLYGIINNTPRGLKTTRNSYSDYIDTPIQLTGGQPFSIQMVVNPTRTVNSKGIIGFGGYTPTVKGLLIAERTDGKIWIYAGNGTSIGNVISTNAIGSNIINTISFSWNGTVSSSATLMINGNSESISIPYAWVGTTALMHNLFCPSGCDPYEGEIQDVRVFNRLLTTQEMKKYHNSFAKQTYITEDFSDAPADGTNIIPTNWIKGTGSYKVGQHIKKSGILYASNFDSSTGWVLESGWSISGGTLNGSSVINYFSATNTAISSLLTTGKKYRVEYTISNYSGSGSVYVKVGTSGMGTVRNGNGSYKEDLTCKGASNYLYFNGWNNFSGSIDDLSITEIDPLPTFKQGTKYLECTSNGVILLPSNQTSGVWEFDVYKGNTTFGCYIFSPNYTINSNHYSFGIEADGTVYLARPNMWLLRTSSSYAQNVWHRIKITRTASGVWSVYIKGGAFGNNFILIPSLSGIGSNPSTDTTFNSGAQFGFSLQSGDRIANIVMKPGIEV